MVAAGIEFTSQLEERSRVRVEEIDIKNMLRGRDVVLLQVVIETGARGSERKDERWTREVVSSIPDRGTIVG